MSIFERFLPKYTVTVPATSTALNFSTETIPFQKEIVKKVAALTSNRAKRRGIEEAYLEADRTHYRLIVDQTKVERI